MKSKFGGLSKKVFTFVCFLMIVSYKPVISESYLYVPNTVTWDEAAQGCLDAGYELAQPSSQEENDVLLGFLASNTASNDEIWIGGHLDDDGVWRWSSGNPVLWTDWSVEDDQPNDLDREKCMRIRRDNNKWWNRECSRKYGYLCQKGSMREAQFNLLKEDKLPEETPTMTYAVTSAAECTLRCMDVFTCRLYSVQIVDDGYLCKLFTSADEATNFLSQSKTRLYSRAT